MNLEATKARATEILRRRANAETLEADFARFVERVRPVGGFDGMLFDCPWEYENYSFKGEAKGAAARYDCVPIEVLRRLPVARLAGPNTACFSWATAPMLDQQIDCMKAWGFKYLGVDCWFKGSPRSEGEPGDETWKPNMGPGYIRRGAAEFILIGAIGKPKWLPTCRAMRNVLFDPAREHSRKPDSQYDRVEQSIAGRYVEIFSRTSRPGWVHFGNQTETFGVAA